jgi:hypothetical protein
MISLEDILVIVQGPEYESTKTSIEYLRSFGFSKENIILSTYEKEKDQEHIDYDCLIAEVNEIKPNTNYNFDVLNKNNYANQILTTSNAFKTISEMGLAYKYVIKIRSDEYYEDYSPLIKKMEDSPSKITCSNLFFRKDFPFHIGDHIMGGTYKNMAGMFATCSEKLVDPVSSPEKLQNYLLKDKYKKYIFNGYYKNGVSKFVEILETNVAPECRLAINYLIYKGKEPLCENHKELMNDYFDVIDIGNMGNFLFNWRGMNISVNEESHEDILATILKGPKYNCTTCPSRILCQQRKRQAQIYNTFDNCILDMRELYDLVDDAAIYNTMYKPHRIAKKFEKFINFEM